MFGFYLLSVSKLKPFFFSDELQCLPEQVCPSSLSVCARVLDE